MNTPIFLSDYRPSDFFITTVHLTFELEPHATVVTNIMQLQRNPDAPWDAPLMLHGEKQSLSAVYLDERLLRIDEYQLTTQSLTLGTVPAFFTLKIISTCDPFANTELEGLYGSNGKFCTQCEPHGFRKITYYLDRPDVMAIFTTTMIGDAALYPVMLSNGNCLFDEVKEGIKTVVWQDPFKKPCYLFALVAGELDVLEDSFVTCSGKSVTLRIFVEPGNVNKTQYAMTSLKQAMRWDEQHYGREYDLAIFMIVAISDFNMGAMENKGLNIFNAKYILADATTATDDDYEGITVVVGHEYFHNWTGNRITCRDWFQLSLKEGLTVFRDQEFCADMTSRPITRIDDVRTLKRQQFPEDAGPLAHPVRPVSYIDMNNFYTATVYNKGAEIVRMLHTLEGLQGFRAGMDQYFDLFDGSAVTCEAFIQAHAIANQRDYQAFMRWYAQIGTPTLLVTDHYDASAHVYTLTIKQSVTETPDGVATEALVIPIRMGLLSEKGQPFNLDAQQAQEKVLVLDRIEQSFVFNGIHSRPIPSLLRGFSAPVHSEYAYTLAHYLTLLRFDVDAYNRFAASVSVCYALALKHTLVELEQWLKVLRYVFTDSSVDEALKARLLTVPTDREFAEQHKQIEVQRAIKNRQLLENALAQALQEEFLRGYERLTAASTAYAFTPQQVGARALKATCLKQIMLVNKNAGSVLCQTQYHNADNMTDRFNALFIMVHYGTQHGAKQLLADFYQRYQQQDLVIEKWFSIQATVPAENTLACVIELLKHPRFDLKNPNKVRAVIGAFASQNFIGFHRADGAGYEFLAEHIIALNAINPLIAARLVEPLSQWQRFTGAAAVLQRSALQRILLTEQLSEAVSEQIHKCLPNASL